MGPQGVWSRRGRQDRLYQIRAIGALADDRAFWWLCSTREEIDAGTGHCRHAMLAELGRFVDAKEMRAAARLICQAKPRARDAMVMLRRWRTGKEAPGDAGGLRDALLRCIQEYLRQHPSVTWPMVRDALANAAAAVEEAAAEAQGNQPE
jgi:hypothetical protein